MNQQSIKAAIETGKQFGQYDSKSQIEQVVRWKVTDAMKLRGQVGGDEGMMQTSCRRITDVIIRDYPTLTDKEFDILLEAGVSGEFSKDTWVSGAVILQWLRQYNRHALRIAIIDEQDNADKETKHRRTKADIEAMNNAACKEKARSAFEYYKQHGTIFGNEKMPEDLKEDERAAYFADKARSFHLPQFAAIVWEWIKAQGGVAEPSEERMLEANRFADDKIASANTRKEYVPAAHDDWRDSYLLEQYYKDLLTN